MDQQVGKLIEPSPVAFSFGAPGWYVLGGLLLMLIVLLIWLLVRHYKSNLYRKLALQFLNDTEQKHLTEKEFDLIIYQTQMLLKRIAMARYGRQNVSGLRGAQWITFINTTWREKSFDDKDEELLNQNIYKSEQNISADEATNFVEKSRRWIRKHKKNMSR